jgi:DNA-binding CsgD family transcriptional regulator
MRPKREERWMIAPPEDLEAWEIDLDGHVFVVFEWPTKKQELAAPLTPAERDVLALVLLGESNAAIARRRHRHVRTIANQVASIFRKIGVGSRLELIARAASRR